MRLSGIGTIGGAGAALGAAEGGCATVSGSVSAKGKSRSWGGLSVRTCIRETLTQ
jgi:hypothetical protein